MKRTHNPQLPPWHEPRPVVLDEAYQREVDRSTEKLERQYRRAEQRVRQAERQLAAAQAKAKRKPSRRAIADLQMQVELRRAELEEFRRLMESSPASSSHRGRKSFRPVPVAVQESRS